HSPLIASHGYLAVDFFLMLSGFVLATTYERRLSFEQLGIAEFIRRRLVRLYPLALIGLVLGCINVLLLRNPGDANQESLASIVLICVLNILLVPNVSSHFGRVLFPVNAPIWSLFLEVLVNAIWSKLTVIRTRCTIAIYAGIIVISGVTLLF